MRSTASGAGSCMSLGMKLSTGIMSASELAAQASIIGTSTRCPLPVPPGRSRAYSAAIATPAAVVPVVLSTIADCISCGLPPNGMPWMCIMPTSPWAMGS